MKNTRWKLLIRMSLLRGRQCLLKINERQTFPHIPSFCLCRPLSPFLLSRILSLTSTANWCGVPEGTRRTEWLPLFYFLPHNLLIISNHCPPLSILSPCQPEIKRGCPLAVGERELSFLDVLLLVAGANWQLVCFPLSFTVCCQKHGFVSWLLIGTYCILPVNSAADFLIYGMWPASTDQTLPAKKSPTEHTWLCSPALSGSSCFVRCLLLCEDVFGVCAYVCASVCVILGQIKRMGTIPAVKPTVKKWNFLFQHRKEEFPG